MNEQEGRILGHIYKVSKRYAHIVHFEGSRTVGDNRESRNLSKVANNMGSGQNVQSRRSMHICT